MLRILSLAMIGAVIAISIPNFIRAAEWTEVTDAGPVLSEAQEPTGSGDLTSIFGTITQTPTDVPLNDLSAFGASVADVDLFRIFISDPIGFSAETLNGDSMNSDLEFDASLALFDENGMGIYSNDDGVFDDGNSILPAGNGFGPMAQGTYYLAIFDDNVTPLSELSLNGPIFPDPGSPFTQVVGPSGPGGASPLLDWFPELPINASRDYTILLTGVTLVPEASALGQVAAALTTVAGLFYARRRSAAYV